MLIPDNTQAPTTPYKTMKEFHVAQGHKAKFIAFQHCGRNKFIRDRLYFRQKVRRKINKALINGVNVNVLSAQKIKIMAVDGAGVFLKRKFNIANLSTHTKRTAAAVQSYTYSKLKFQRLCDAIPYSLQAQRICEYYFCHY